MLPSNKHPNNIYIKVVKLPLKIPISYCCKRLVDIVERNNFACLAFLNAKSTTVENA